MKLNNNCKELKIQYEPLHQDQQTHADYYSIFNQTQQEWLSNFVTQQVQNQLQPIQNMINHLYERFGIANEIDQQQQNYYNLQGQQVQDQQQQGNQGDKLQYNPDELLKKRAIKMIYPINRKKKEFDKYVLSHANEKIGKMSKINYNHSKSLQTNSSSNQNEQPEQLSQEDQQNQNLPQKQNYLKNLIKIRPKQQTVLIEQEIQKQKTNFQNNKKQLRLAESQQELQQIYQQIKVMVESKKQNKIRSWTEEEKKQIVMFVKSGQMFGRDWKMLIKLADISPSSYKRWKKAWK